MQWLDPRDERFDWLNVADWEARGDGWQPVRVPKLWRDKWPAKTARRGMSAAGMALRFRTDSKKLLLRVTFVDSPDSPPSTPAAGWERSRPNFFSLYRDGKYVASVAALTHFERQDVTIFDDAEIAAEAEIQVLLPFYYRNAEIILHAVGIERGARLNKAEPRQGPRISFTATRSPKATASPAQGKLMFNKSPTNSTASESITVSAAPRGRTTSSPRRSPRARTGTCS